MGLLQVALLCLAALPKTTYNDGIGAWTEWRKLGPREQTLFYNIFLADGCSPNFLSDQSTPNFISS